MISLKKYFDEGYYLAIEVVGATRRSQHWVSLYNISGNKILMLAPATLYVDMWDRYIGDNATQLVYFKVNKQLAFLHFLLFFLQECKFSIDTLNKLL